MLQLSGTMIGRPVLSLRTGQRVATVTSALINPNNLKIEGFYCQDSFDKKTLVLLYQDIRDVLPDGLVVNDHEVMAEPSELVRLKSVMDVRFELIGKAVQTVSKQRIGKVSDYAVETETMFIQKLYVAQSMLKSFTGGSLSVDRSQIQEITDRKVIILDPLKDAAVPVPAI